MSAPILPDDLWQKIEPLIPRQRRRRRGLFAGRKPEDPRKIMAGIIFCLKTGVPWEYLPPTEEFASGRTCRKWMIKWHKAHVWQNLFATLLVELQHERKIDWRRAIIDSASVRATHRGKKTGKNPVDRGKFGSKHHIIIDAHGIPLAVNLTGANRHDVTQLLPLVEKIRPLRGQRGRPRKRPTRLLGDRGYDSEPHRRALKKRGSHHS